MDTDDNFDFADFKTSAEDLELDTVLDSICLRGTVDVLLKGSLFVLGAMRLLYDNAILDVVLFVELELERDVGTILLLLKACVVFVSSCDFDLERALGATRRL